MSEGFFPNLPFEITVDILSRLPIRTIVTCKCVCKLWLKLLDSHEFAKCHLSKSALGMAVSRTLVEPTSCEIFEFEDIIDLGHHDLHYSSVTKFVFPHRIKVIWGSANGLLFLTGDHVCDLYICNPITRHYIKLYSSQDSVRSGSQIVTYGFGMAKLTSQPKVVRIVDSYCEVYALGTRTWRSITPGSLKKYDGMFGVFLNGNLHWLVFDEDPNTPLEISCFDLETELFSSFSHPPLQASGSFDGNLSAFVGCLCLCDNSSEDKIVIWLMREYGVEASWTKEYVISNDLLYFGDNFLLLLEPIKVFKIGDILMSCQDLFLIFYSDKTKTIRQIDMFEADVGNRDLMDALPYTPSFLSLKSFEMEDLRSL